MLFFRFIPKHKFYVISFNDRVPRKMYEVAPSSWMVHEEAVWFCPEYTSCKIQEAVEQGSKPLPKKDFQKYSCKVLYETGEPNFRVHVELVW